MKRVEILYVLPGSPGPRTEMKAKKAAELTFRFFKRANRGLYGKETIKFGDSVSEMGNRTRRSFKPNDQYVSLFSEQAGRSFRVRATVDVIKKIDEAGGLDNYLLGQQIPESWFAERLRYQVLTAKWKKELAVKDDALFNPA